jgi:hypothetical protein
MSTQIVTDDRLRISLDDNRNGHDANNPALSGQPGWSWLRCRSRRAGGLGRGAWGRLDDRSSFSFKG